MKTLSEEKCKIILQKILSNFGEGKFEEGRYYFDFITTIPKGYTDLKIRVSELLDKLEEFEELLIVFDPNPQNQYYVRSKLRENCAEDLIAGVCVTSSQLKSILEAADIDMYICDQCGNLLAVATHEDLYDSDERIIWCLVPVEK